MTANQKQDMNSNCPYWAGIGECDKNPNYMWWACVPSCEKKSIMICHKLKKLILIWITQ